MTDDQISEYLRVNGYPEHLVRGGSAGLIEGWRRFVEEVEHGYKFGLEDYRNDLDLRGIIELVGLDGQTGDLDHRFEALLINRGVRVWESSSNNAPWDFGYPRNAGSQLLEDLKKEGLTIEAS